MKRSWLLLVLLAASVPAAAATMYSWTDANGVRHFSDTPPPTNSIKAQKLKVTGGSGARVEAEQEGEAAKGSGPALAAAAGYSPEDIVRNCETARSNLSALEARKPTMDADGNPPDPEAVKIRQSSIERAQQQIQLFCAKK